MQLGRIGIWTYHLNYQSTSKVREVVAELEELGYGALWVGEAVYREPLTNAAVLLGLGVSHARLVEGLRGHRYERPLTTMRRYLDAMDQAAEAYRAVKPGKRPARVLAALGPKMLALAAERADGAHPYLVTPEHTAKARAQLGPDRWLLPEQAVVLEADPACARAIARRHLSRYLDLPNYTDNFRRLGFTDDDLAGRGSDRLVDAIVAWGEVDRVMRRVMEHLDAGANHVAIQVFDADPHGLPMRQWRALAPALS
jgi:probable F420-dependent oxidoreductase